MIPKAISGLNGSVHDDILVGTFQSGKFVPYGNTASLEAVLDDTSDESPRRLASKGVPIHGSYKAGNFRPVDAYGKPGFLRTIHVGELDYIFNYRGELINDNGQIVGAIDKDGNLLSYQEYQASLKKK